MTDGIDALIPIGQATKVPVELLDFDQNNPRFTPDKRPDGNGDAAVVAMLATSADLAELLQSISTSGYINIEPLIVIERNARLAVLEGNRRLAAVKALRDPELAKAAKVSVPDMAPDKLSTLNELLAFRVASEDDARDLIGFKHINGPQSWDAFAKARFAARWLDSEHEKQQAGQKHLTLQQIAGRMGDQHSTMHRMVTALFVLEQAEREEIYSVEDRRKKSFSFSHLYTGLAYEEFTSFLGMDRPDRTTDPDRNPVPKEKENELGQLLIWLYGSKEKDLEPVVKSQNPDLGRLRNVLGSPEAIRVLASRHSLDEAVATATPADLRFQQHLIAANAELQHAVSTLEGFDPESQPELQRIAESALKRAQVIKFQVDAQVAAQQEVGQNAKGN
ncbi:ParB N-terminal domain-containing protein [Aureimonas altamirensis]|uniref:ParB N-terminal domain-containing protein n=1 Tax=Aureimonas altamirensis TaxID=370622 RepID=UPI0009DCA4DB|nr:ParB N-terminal domain-containing protein [Aureimonas altamirensis]